MAVDFFNGIGATDRLDPLPPILLKCDYLAEALCLKSAINFASLGRGSSSLSPVILTS